MVNDIPVIKKYFYKFQSWKQRVLFQKVKSLNVKIWQSIKSISLKSRSEKIEEFDKAVETNHGIYFTTDLKKTGFTDQLIGFSFLYRLGLDLKLKYYHTRLTSRRSSDPFLFYPYTGVKNLDEDDYDVFDFLGVNSYLAAQWNNEIPKDIKKVWVSLNKLFNVDSISSYEDLLKEVKCILHPFIQKKSQVLLIFECNPRIYFKYYHMSSSKSGQQLDFREAFEEQRKNLSLTSNFKKDKKKILVHIRQGDTGTIKTPWNTYIPTWNEVNGKYTQFDKKENIPFHRLVDVNDFFEFLEDLFKNCYKNSFSTRLFSDGYKKTFKAIYQSYKPKNITHQEVAKLRDIETEYDKMQFVKFREELGIETIIGEDVEKLYDFIHSFMEANILIFGTQGALIPKFLSTYGEKSNLPLMIVLYRSVKPSLNYLGFDDSADYLIYVNLDDYDVGMISQKIDHYIETINW